MAKKLNVRVRENSTDVLYGKLLMYAEQVHQGNKRRIRHGLVSLIVIPIVLMVVLLLTESSRIVFLLIWIACMFVVAAFLLYVAYSDWMLQTTINELSRDELGELDSLITVKQPRSLKLLKKLEEESCKQKSIAEVKKVPQNLHS